MTAIDLIKLLIVAAAGYLLGSINSSLIVGRFYGVDVRQHGSGNAGATNTLRTLGKGAAILTTLGDLLKGFIACVIGFYLFTEKGFTLNFYNRTLPLEDIGLMSGGLAAIVGHNWPVYFGFKGGKGVLTTFIVALMMDWKTALILLGLFIIVVAVTRFVSLGSILAAAMLPIVGLIMNRSNEFIVFSLLLALLVIVRHRSNIERIIKGTETKLSFKKKSEKSIEKSSEV